MINRAVVMTDIQKLEIREVPMPVCGDGDVLVKTNYVGICGSDAHFFETGEIGASIIHPPFILGHEYSGTVTEVGKDVRNLKVGDRVTLEPGVPCGECSFCKAGRYNMCEKMSFKSSPPTDGLFCEYLTHPAHLAFKLPASVSLIEGALMEPLAVGMYASRMGDVKLGDTVLILGSGTIGLTTLLGCKERRAGKIIVTDMVDYRLEKAKALGADYVINAGRENVIDKVMEYTGGKGAQVVFETAGSKYTALQTSYCVARCGRIVMVGIVLGEIPFNFRQMNTKEADLKTIWRYCNEFPRAIEAVSQKAFSLDGLVTDEYNFTDAQAAFKKSIEDKEHVIKIVLKFCEE